MAFKIRKNALCGDPDGELTTLPSPLVGWRGDTPLQTRPARFSCVRRSPLGASIWWGPQIFLSICAQKVCLGERCMLTWLSPGRSSDRQNAFLSTSKGKVKVLPYSLPSVGTEADPGVQAVRLSPQLNF